MPPAEDYAKNKCDRMYECRWVDDEDESSLNPRSPKLCKEKDRSALAQEAVLRERLVVVITPCCQVRVGVCLNVPMKEDNQSLPPSLEPCNVLVDIGGSREVLRIAANVLHIRILIHADVVDFHCGRESQVVDIDETEVP